MEGVNVSHSDAQQVLKDFRKSNVNKLVFGQLKINSLRKKIDTLSEIIKDFVDIFMISDTKLDDSFPEVQFFIDGYHTSLRYERNRNSGGIFLYLHEDIPANVIHCDVPAFDSFFVEINLQKYKWSINSSSNPQKKNIYSHLNVIAKKIR